MSGRPDISSLLLSSFENASEVRLSMLRLEDIKSNAAVTGLEPGQVVRIVTTERVGNDALTVYYKTADGKLRERMLFRADEANISLAEAGRPWAFDAPGEDFKLAAEAYRIDLAHLFDPMMAVHTSNVEPLPHQITAVYESMLPRQPLRYVLADDPGAGKTIMAGLFIRELLMRADAKRVLIVTPGSLVDQWQDEMFEKFGLTFDLEPVSPEDRARIEDILNAPWITQDLEPRALGHASASLVPAHFNEVRERRERQVDKTLAAVHERLVVEINFWSDRYIKLQEDIATGKDVRLPGERPSHARRPHRAA